MPDINLSRGTRHRRRSATVQQSFCWLGQAFTRIMGQVMTRQETINEITRRLVEYYQPERIYLFGSVARGDAGPDSDLDFLVVLPDDAPQHLYRPGIHRALWGTGIASDVVPWPASDFDARALHVAASLPATVLREGRLLYDTRRVAA